MTASGSNFLRLVPPQKSPLSYQKSICLVFADVTLNWCRSLIFIRPQSIQTKHCPSDAQKLQYLKLSLKGKSYRLISSLTIKNTNYSVALTISRKRYENKKVIFREHIHSIVSFNAIKCENATLLWKLIKTTDKNVSCLQNLGVDAEAWDPIPFYLITERLDAVTRKDWEQHSLFVLPFSFFCYETSCSKIHNILRVEIFSWHCIFKPSFSSLWKLWFTQNYSFSRFVSTVTLMIGLPSLWRKTDANVWSAIL